MLSTCPPVAAAVHVNHTSAPRAPQFEGPSVPAPVLSKANGPVPEIAVAFAQRSFGPTRNEPPGVEGWTAIEPWVAFVAPGTEGAAT
jgi:hypothetical protein